MPDKNTGANLEPEDPNEGSQRGGNSGNGDPETGGAEAAETAKLVSELDDGQHSEAELRIGFTETDTNQNGRINIDEFRAWWLNG